MTAETPAPPVVIAVDGAAASGKGTLSRRLARHFGYAHLDTGLLYRATGLALIRAGKSAADETAAIKAAENLDPDALDDPALRGDAVAAAASAAAAVPGVRAALLDVQRRFAAAPPDGRPGAVLDGRDIGTVICPEATHKIFVEAAIGVRAARRVKELRESGADAIHARVLRDMKARDARDRHRSVAPLTKASDAFLLDTTELDADGVFAAALEFITSRTPSGA